MANEYSRVIYPGFGNLGMMGSFANWEYNALQVRVVKRLSQGFMIQGAYTFSKAMDNSSSSIADTASIPNPFNLSGEWGLADFYAKHIASIAGIWNMPQLLRQNIFVRELAGGWNLSLQ